MKSKILKTEFKNIESERIKWRNYMRERRRKIKLGILKPTPFSLQTKTKIKHYHRDYQRKSRELAIKHYGGKCACCGESEIKFLAIDHINGGGRKHRKEIGGNISRWLIMNDYPVGFQILCHNCNTAKGLYGECPHKMLTK